MEGAWGYDGWLNLAYKTLVFSSSTGFNRVFHVAPRSASIRWTHNCTIKTTSPCGDGFLRLYRPQKSPVFFKYDNPIKLKNCPTVGSRTAIPLLLALPSHTHSWIIMLFLLISMKRAVSKASSIDGNALAINRSSSALLIFPEATINKRC